MSELVWYLERATGITALALLVLSTTWGLLLSTRLLRGRMQPRSVLEGHRFLALLAIVFTGAHILGALVQSHVDIGLDGVLVPFASGWEPVAIGLGTLATYLLVAVYLTSVWRSRIGPRAWRAVHYAGFALFWVAALHTLMAGTDASGAALRLGVIASMVAVGGLVAIRALSPPGGTARRASRVAASPRAGRRPARGAIAG